MNGTSSCAADPATKVQQGECAEALLYDSSRSALTPKFSLSHTLQGQMQEFFQRGCIRNFLQKEVPWTLPLDLPLPCLL